MLRRNSISHFLSKPVSSWNTRLAKTSTFLLATNGCTPAVFRSTPVSMGTARDMLKQIAQNCRAVKNIFVTLIQPPIVQHRRRTSVHLPAPDLPIPHLDSYFT